jgi:hypothetical protein
MPKGHMQMTAEQRAVQDAQKLTDTFAKRFSKKLGAIKATTVAKDLQNNLKSFSGAATKQLKDAAKDAATRGPGKKAAATKPAKTSKSPKRKS